MAPEEIQVKILVMGRYFLYLPLYVAQSSLPKFNKHPFFGLVPERFVVSVKPPIHRKDQTDGAVFDALMDAQPGSSDIMFAACDPTVLLERPAQNARLIASLVSTSAFWAVNHEDQPVQLVSDLNRFDRIICYGERTTSNLIARRIVRGKTEKLQPVQAQDELQELERIGAGALAISPEPLTIAAMRNAPVKPNGQRINVVLDLCTCREFSNVLTTALFTRADVIDRHPELVRGVLGALQMSLDAIHRGHPMLPSCIRENWRDHEYHEEALASALDGNVFPETIQVRRDRWKRACEFYFVSQAMADGKNKNKMNTSEERKAEELYNQAVLDPGLGRCFDEGIRLGLSSGTDGARPVSSEPLGVLPVSARLFNVLVPLAAGVGVGHALSAGVSGAALVSATSWILMLVIGWWTSKIARYQQPSVMHVAHWVVFLLFWWGLHEALVHPAVTDAAFFRGTGGARDVWLYVSACAFTYLVGASFRSTRRASSADRKGVGISHGG